MTTDNNKNNKFEENRLIIELELGEIHHYTFMTDLKSYISKVVKLVEIV